MDCIMDDVQVDAQRYDRQEGLLGNDGMLRMRSAKVLLIGLGGLGIEIAKNLVLGGIKELHLLDTDRVSENDLCDQFYLTEEDIRNEITKAEASLTELQHMNADVDVCLAAAESPSKLSTVDLLNFTCVILTYGNFSEAESINLLCRQVEPALPFVYANIRGLFGVVFCDFGPKFEVENVSGELPKSVLVGDIEKGIVLTPDMQPHDFTSGTVLKFIGVERLRNMEFEIDEIISSFALRLKDAVDVSIECNSGIRAIEVKKPRRADHVSFKDCLTDLSKIQHVDFRKNSVANHLSFLTLDEYRRRYDREPRATCTYDAQMFCELATEILPTMPRELRDQINFDKAKDSWQLFAQCCEGSLTPLNSVVGGLTSQEVFKAITKKTSPLNQLAYFDVLEISKCMLSSQQDSPPCTSTVHHCERRRRSRYRKLDICLGDAIRKELSALRIFMVGCGAIGCELLKVLALMGVSSNVDGGESSSEIIVTDSDIIEKSNLNRQFLFREQHIGQSKSCCASEAIQRINSEIKITAKQLKVCPETESTFHDTFFDKVNYVLLALDNVEARLYMDCRCVSNAKPLLDSGTVGLMGHVQVVVPYLTESYGSQHDRDTTEQVPMCTLRSFPERPEHTIEWAREKFYSQFTQKPEIFNKVWSQYQKIEDAMSPTSSINKDAVQAANMLLKRPCDWTECLQRARLKFEKWYNWDIARLLEQLPLNHVTSDGTPFWKPPKMMPHKLSFDSDNKRHVDFVVSTAKIFAVVYGILSTKDCGGRSNAVGSERFKALDKNWHPKPSNFRKLKRFDSTGNEVVCEENHLDPEAFRQLLRDCLSEHKSKSHVSPIFFEKDCNAHVDFIYAASSLRAEAYSLEPADRTRTKLIAGNIIPAIATTTATVAGLVGIELLKMVAKLPLSEQSNAFLNLGIPSFIFSEPAPPPPHSTPWGRWDIHGNAAFTVKELIDCIESKQPVSKVVSVSTSAGRLVFSNFSWSKDKQASQLKRRMNELLLPQADVSHVALTVCGEDQDMKDVAYPAVVYYFN